MSFYPGLVSISFRRYSVDEILDACKSAGLSLIEWGSDVHVPAGNAAIADEVAAKTREAGLSPSLTAPISVWAEIPLPSSLPTSIVPSAWAPRSFAFGAALRAAPKWMRPSASDWLPTPVPLPVWRRPKG